MNKGYDIEILPNGEEIFDFTRRITNLALGNLINETVESLESYSWNFIRSWLKYHDISEVYLHPTIHSCKNILQHMFNAIHEYDAELGEPTELAEVFVVPGVNEIVHLKRQVRKEVLGIDKL